MGKMISSIFGGGAQSPVMQAVTAPPPPPPVPEVKVMPVADDAKLAMAKKQEAIRRKGRGGRMSTLLSSGGEDSLGG